MGERIINKPYDAAWSRLVESLPRAGESVVKEDAKRGLIVVERPIQGCHLLFDNRVTNWYYGKIRTNILMDRVSAETTRAVVEVNFVELYDVSRGILNILGSAEVFREEVLFSNLSTEEHYLNYIENAMYQEKPRRRTFWERLGWGIENLPTKTTWGW